ncbi:CopY/TcrY family copper transport repressor [Atopococcus tabaci]|uniref:CopY/TcrY family copper transport repressor n=1 Tax=Atopococcus tabaci TaxID=269774 RepID=UPI0004136647|nr:CopY/TcrY family copper transport repressor [Atopococcus tabaci]
MATKEAAPISAAEWEVMRVVWTAEKTTSKEISEVLNEKMKWKPATTKTLIGRLVKKGLLHTEAEGRRYVYSPAVSESESIREASEDLLQHICNKKVGKTLAGMLEEATLSQEDIHMLEELLKEKKKTAPEEIMCDCLPGQCDCHHEMKGA